MPSLSSSCLWWIGANDHKRPSPLMCVFVMVAAKNLGIGFTI